MTRNRSRSLLATAVLALAPVALLARAAASETSDPAADDLRPPSAFASIADEDERSAALFTEASRVLLHPRCVSCHPAGDRPLAGENSAAHEPPASRGRGGRGVTGMHCGTCHLDENFDPGRVPGAPHWALAPRSMAWEGLSPREVCEQVKDPARNGRRPLDVVVEHFTDDALVAWGWTPGADREPAPGTQEQLGELIRAWVESGAVCPE
jgi:hypothetical protein